jgi:RNA polymerase sigma-70 factor (ECF subfamily)
VAPHVASKPTARRSPIEGPDADPTVEQYVDGEERRRVLDAAACLAPEDQEILRLTLWEEISSSAAGAVLGISPDAAKQRASRARRRLAIEFHRRAPASNPQHPTEEEVAR